MSESTAVMADLNAAAERIWQDSEASCPGLSLDVMREIDSTNTALMQRGRQGQVSPTLMVAAEQRAGRGRQGRQWQSSLGDCLTFSLALPMQFDDIPGGASALSLAVGLSLAQSLDQGVRQTALDAGLPTANATAIGLKWPNDLHLQGLKLGGILIEASPSTALPPTHRWVVIGVGLNVRQGPDSASALWTHHPACSSGLLRPSLGQVWSWLAPALIRDVQRFETQGFAPVHAAYASRDVLRGQNVGLWTTPGQSPHQGHAPSQVGQALGVGDTGALLVHTDNGPQSWTSGEVSVRLQTP